MWLRRRPVSNVGPSACERLQGTRTLGARISTANHVAITQPYRSTALNAILVNITRSGSQPDGCTELRHLMRQAPYHSSALVTSKAPVGA
jgi:hypothetical protein